MWQACVSGAAGGGGAAEVAAASAVAVAVDFERIGFCSKSSPSADAVGFAAAVAAVTSNSRAKTSRATAAAPMTVGDTVSSGPAGSVGAA